MAKSCGVHMTLCAPFWLGVCVENALISSSSQPDEFLGHKWWISSETNARGEIQKRNKRLIVPRQDVLPAPEVTKAFEVPSPAPQAAQKSRRKGNRNSKKKGNGNGKDEMTKVHKSFSETDKTLKKQNKMKKTNTVVSACYLKLST
ncbi:uncharacterized protein LOC129218312 [Uloborus diversus]|uniref:uncharacterized protein LOC129218312 n=1 Tax=Uloborus diversus TaxID=327109 RepID=UPI00240995C6|nr:uncharacterized protein LOC129218312 [Uloborus diversus]